MVFVASAIGVFAQKVKLITDEERLSNSLVNHVYQDSRGYIWIATEDGLNSFDGITVTSYQAGDAENAMSSSYIQRVFEDSSGRLWIGLINGICIFNRETGDFRRVECEAQGEIVKPHISDIVEDKSGDVWFVTSGRGIMKYDATVQKAVRDMSVIGQNGDHFLSAALVDKLGYLWVAPSSCSYVYRCNVDGTWNERIFIENNAQISDNSQIIEAYGHIYLSTDRSGIFCYDEHAHKFRHIDTVENALIFSICSYNNKLFIGTDGQGLYTYDIQTQKVEQKEFYTPQIDFHKAKIHSIMFDWSGNIWLALFQKGVLYMPHSLSPFENYGYHPNGWNNIGSGCVMSVFRDHNGLWVGADSDALYYVDDDGKSSHFENGVPKTIMGIEPEGERYLWLASYDDGLYLFDKTTKSAVSKNNMLMAVSPSFSSRTICMAHDNKGRLWLGTFGNGVFCIDGNRVKNYVSTTEIVDFTRNEPVNNWINAICAYGDEVWFCTYNGLCCYNTVHERFVPIDDELYKAFAGKVVSDMEFDDAGKMWLATAIGLAEYDTASHSLNIINREQGIASNGVISVCVDKMGYVWAGTYAGLSRYDTETQLFNNYYSHDGIQGNQFSRAAVDIDKNNGQVFIGGTNGVTRLRPFGKEKTDLRMSVSVTHFYLNGHEVFMGDLSDGKPIIDKAVVDADKFSFSYGEKTFAFDLSSFNFINPELITYEYKMDGYDTEWNQTQNGDYRISYSNMPPGEYTLNISSRVGSSNSAVRQINIEILPLWWQTTWAKALYVALALLALVLLYAAMRFRMKIKQEFVRQQQEHNIEEAKFQFFFNISHEIRTPLTLILNPIKELMRKAEPSSDEQRSYATIHRNAMRILRLINQLLDMRKIEKGQMVMHYKQTDIEKLIDSISQFFTASAAAKKVKFRLINVLNDNIVAVDPDYFDKVIYNLYSNAIKFTSDKSEIVTQVSERSDGRIAIEVIDCGCGIEPDKLEMIFNRFYQIDNRQNAAYTGTGIGLHFARSIVNLHGGTISARNREDGLGAIFTVIIPRHQKDEMPYEQVVAERRTVSEPELEEHSLVQVKRHKPQTNKRVLIVDDEAEVSQILVTELSKVFRVISCTNGKEAYDILRSEHIDAVVSDIMMPVMDGLTLCHKLKSNITINHIPIVLLTAKHSDEDRNRGLLTGADAYIAKPFDLEELKNTLCSIIENRDRIMNRFATVQNNETQEKKVVNLRTVDEVLMEKITNYIEKNIADPDLNVEKMASHVGLSRVHMHRKIKEITSQSARDYIRNIRLRQAGILLGEKRLSISEVAFSLGFSNLSHFSTSFKEMYGMSPSDYMNEKLSDQSE